MIIKKIEEYETSKKAIIPLSYVNALIACDNQPEQICVDYGEVNLFSVEEFIEAQEYLCIYEFCPEYLAIGNTSDGKVLLMKQDKNANQVIITGAGNLLPKYWDNVVCIYIDNFNEWLEKGLINFWESDE